MTTDAPQKLRAYSYNYIREDIHDAAIRAERENYLRIAQCEKENYEKEVHKAVNAETEQCAQLIDAKHMPRTTIYEKSRHDAVKLIRARTKGSACADVRASEARAKFLEAFR